MASLHQILKSLFEWIRPRRTEFRPDWVSAPGETVQDILDEWDLSEEKFSEMSGLSMEEIDQLLRGTLLIDSRVAEKLTCLGAPARFWLRREQLYREEVLRLKHGNHAR